MRLTGARPLVAVALIVLIGTPASAGPLALEVVPAAKRRAELRLAPRATRDATLIVSFGVGSVDDGIRAGLTRLTQHMIVDGNVREPAALFRRDLYAAAAELEVVTGVHRAMFILRAPRRSFSALAKRLLTLTLDAEIDPRAEERCKSLTLRDEMGDSSRPAVEAFVAGELFFPGEGAVAGADYRNPPFGEADVVRELTSADVEAHVRRYFRPANATVVATGAFNRTQLKKIVMGFKGGRASRPVSPQQAGVLPVTLERRAGRSLAYDIHLVGIEDASAAAAAHLLLITLEDRLRRRMPKPSAAAAVRTYPMMRSWTRALVIEVPGGGPDVDVTFSQVEDAILAAGFVAGEYERTRTVALREFDRVDRRTRDLALALVHEEEPLWHTAATRDALLNLTQADFLRHVRPWLAPERKIVVHLGRSYARASR